MPLRFATPTDDAVPLYLLEEADVEPWLNGQPDAVRQWVTAHEFSAALGQSLVIPGPDGVMAALVGFGSHRSRQRERFHLAAGTSRLPKGTYALSDWPKAADPETETVGFQLSRYRFDRYRGQSSPGAMLCPPPHVDTDLVQAIVGGETLARDLINTPAADMGPPDLESAARALAEHYGADFDVTVGDALLEENYPMIHAVGRAADRAPRLIDFRWGNTGPKITLVGKGVCFDTGGLNLKPGGSMGLMKKDMGGAANVLGLASMLMASGAPIQLRVLVPAVENSVSGNAFRPQDILMSRKGLTVEINNTDAEGRLVLADALALADEDAPDLIVSMATLTGAARVAVGPDIAPFYTDDGSVAAQLEAAAAQVSDPVWRMPFHTPYEKMIEPGIADLDNAPKGGFAGSITAALFLRRFVTETPRYLHFDIYGWQPTDAPARSKGGVGQGIRALFKMLPNLVVR